MQRNCKRTAEDKTGIEKEPGCYETVSIQNWLLYNIGKSPISLRPLATPILVQES